MTDQRIAAVDIGSNTAHVLVASVEAGQLIELCHYVEMTDLGSQVDRTGSIGATKCLQLVEALERVVMNARKHRYQRLVAGATAVMRTARDAATVLQRASSILSVPVRVLQPQREAELTFIGVASRHAGTGSWLMADVGGGSTELVAAHANIMLDWRSFLIGSSSLARRYLSDPPTNADQQHVTELVRLIISSSLPSDSVQKLVVTGGTASYIGRLPGIAANANSVTERQLAEVIQTLISTPANAMAHQTGLPVARVRALCGGTFIIGVLLNLLNLRSFEISQEGIHHGMVLAAATRGADWWR